MRRRNGERARELSLVHLGCHAAPMLDNRFRLPDDELYASAQVPLDEQVEVQSELVLPPVDWRVDPMPWVDGGSGDVDGD